MGCLHPISHSTMTNLVTLVCAVTQPCGVATLALKFHTILGLYPPIENHCIRGKEKDACKSERQKGQYKREKKI